MRRMKDTDPTSRHNGTRPVGEKVDTTERSAGCSAYGVDKQEVLLNQEGQRKSRQPKTQALGKFFDDGA